MVIDIKYEDAQKKDHFLIIDVRSPSEFLDATIPGAINIPLFDDQERAIVGTAYKEQGPDKAKEIGLQIVSPKIPQLIHKIKAALAGNKIPLFFCWRGGMRSKTMATLYDLMFQDAYRLEGGYRAYREYILKQIDEFEIKIPTFVLHGMTGVGKTSILHKLEQMGVTVVDLEGLAGHRGSIFGGIGNVNPVNQKTFDSKIYEIFKQIKKARAIVIEAESKRIGKILVPDNILKAKENGYHILINADINVRIERIIEEYNPEKNKDSISEAITKILKRIPTEHRESITSALERDDFYTIVDIMLNYYYDPRYRHSTTQYQGAFYEVNSDDLNEATINIFNYIQQILNETEVLVK
ncbi:tRNA 2-selenouridine(34) synthase MnmH [Vulcanibacillus modesticaldus]|uniref:tRNA 2-selenouridine(34) synthase MnmH n=1 Tax=Vulcanibacillus modesticaldus TaxID=337097 RepID=A0A1D2YU84_9BACI|nr:tRNA 2-selenouridine(34) synthase MnmH [Vulcanibacillus modesticaldus]OEF99270.1 tRNA 2-selenouridine(34) synthase MnmH [Vulcanibacillus modesticaldus]